MPIRPKPTRVNNAYERLKLDIMRSELPPGFQAPEPEIAERLGMSRTPVREALIRLEADGLVDLVPRRGVRVRGMSREDMREVYNLLCVLEPLAVRQVCCEDEIATVEAFAAMDVYVESMRTAEQAGEIDAWAEAELGLRRMIIELGRNRRLSTILASLFDQLQRGRLVLLRLMPMPVGSADRCAAILEAMQARDPDMAEQLMCAYRQDARALTDEVFQVSRLSQV
ncbi:GntR family transcriptional regulator [Roseibium sp. CAU 1637]|uniref:GntR family transcriptional regulator n=1 Tax=Roseibium limicola TaxID=2816037 RepID=A0A939JBE9_9HYPH|nr:GntR family transcriptional regulator [Roseibium limicola]MBO0347393.1 GntR family transcriptional regulator [Roseibium limicola]